MHRTAITALVLALAACGVDPEVEPDPVPTVDAGTDAGTDAGSDAGSDAGTEPEPEPTPTGPFVMTIENASTETITIGFVVVRDRTDGWISIQEDLSLDPGASTNLEAPRSVCRIGAGLGGDRLWMKLSPVHYSGDQWATIPPLLTSGASWQSAPTYAYDVPCARTSFRVVLERSAEGEPSVTFSGD